MVTMAIAGFLWEILQATAEADSTAEKILMA